MIHSPQHPIGHTLFQKFRKKSAKKITFCWQLPDLDIRALSNQNGATSYCKLQSQGFKQMNQILDYKFINGIQSYPPRLVSLNGTPFFIDPPRHRQALVGLQVVAAKRWEISTVIGGSLISGNLHILYMYIVCIYIYIHIIIYIQYIYTVYIYTYTYIYSMNFWEKMRQIQHLLRKWLDPQRKISLSHFTSCCTLVCPSKIKIIRNQHFSKSHYPHSQPQHVYLHENR